MTNTSETGERNEFAEAIIRALSEADEVYQDGGYIDDDDLSNVCIDGWFNLERVAEKLTAKGYGKSLSND